MRFFDFNYFLPFTVILLLSSLFWRQPMNLGRTVFSQLVELLPTYQFQLCVERYQGNRYVKDFSCWDQFLCLAFAQLTYRESLRDIEACLRAQQPKLYHMGFRGQVSRNTLAHANEHRDWRIYADFARMLIATARDLYQRRTVRRGIGRDRLRLGFHHHRFVPGAVSLGENSAATKAP